MYENTNHYSSNAVHYSNLPSIAPDLSIENQQQKTIETIYQNLESQSSIDDMYSKVIKEQQPIETIVAEKKSVISPRINDNQRSTSNVVKDLVKRFNQQ